MSLPNYTANQTAVSELYVALLGRNPDQGGFSFWVNQLNNGTSQTTVANEFAFQPEFFNIYGQMAPQSAVGAFYLNVFGRPADQGGLAYWTNYATNLITQLVQGGQQAGAATVMAYAQTATAMVDYAYTENNQDGTNIRALVNAATEAGTGQTGSTVTLTTTPETATANIFNGTLTPAAYSVSGPTVLSQDKLTGVAGLTTNTLNIYDDYAAGTDIMPAGITLNNIQNINLTTSGNAGQGGSAFDTSAFSSVTSTTVTSNGSGTDYVQASSANSSITVTHSSVNGGVDTFGGTNVTVTTNGNGGVNVGAYTAGSSQSLATGAVVVNANGLLAGSAAVNVIGGASVEVHVNQASATGDITIGNVSGNLGAVGDATTTSDNATGAIIVQSVSTAGNTDTIYGGSTVNVTVAGDTVIVGDVAGTAHTNNEATGAIVVTDEQAHTFTNLTGADSIGGGVSVFGGTSVSVSINTGGQVQIGTDNIASTLPTGAITLVDTATDLSGAFGIGQYNDPLGGPNIMGGTTVNATLAGESVYIGVDGAATGPYIHTIDNPTGLVTVTETVASTQNIYVDGGNGVQVDALGQSVALGTFTGVSGPITVNQGSYTANNAITSTAYTGNALGSSNEDSSITVDGGTTVNINTTGGDVFVGGSANNINDSYDSNGDHLYHTATGNVTIRNTFSGAGTANDSSVNVLGGAAVSITETNSTDSQLSVTQPGGVGTAVTRVTGGITVGGANPVADSVTGLTLANANLFATGNVSITNVATDSLSNEIYGTAQTIVRMDGGTTATITGGDLVEISDVNQLQQTDLSTTVGTSHLTTAILDGVETGGCATGAVIDSGVFSNLTIKDSSVAIDTKVTVGTGNEMALGYASTFNGNSATEGAHTLNLTLNNDAASSITDNTATTVVLNDAGTAANTTTIQADNATTVTISNSNALTATITANEAHTVNINSAAATSATITADDVATVNVSGAGSVTLNLGGADAASTLNYSGTGGLSYSGSNSIANIDLAAISSGAVNLDLGGASDLASVIIASGSSADVTMTDLYFTGESSTAFTITDSGSGSLSIGGASDSSQYLTSINASTSSGEVEAYINGQVTSFTGGSGNDYINVQQGLTQSITGGSGTNEIDINFSGGAVLHSYVTGFQTVNLDTDASGTYDVSGGRVSDFMNLNVNNTTGSDVTFSEVKAGAVLNLEQYGSGSDNLVTYLLGAYTGNDSVTVNVGSAYSDGNITQLLATPNIQTVNLNINNFEANNIIQINDSGIHTLKLTDTGSTWNSLFLYQDNAGSSGDSIYHLNTLALFNGADNSSLTTIDASGTSGAINLLGWGGYYNASVDALNYVAGSIQGINIIGGSGWLFASGTINAAFPDGPYQYIGNIASDVQQSSTSMTFEGNFAAGQVTSVRIDTGGDFSSPVFVTESYTAASGDSAQQVAQGLATQINSDTVNDYATAVAQEVNGVWTVTVTQVNPQAYFGITNLGVTASTAEITASTTATGTAAVAKVDTVTINFGGGTQSGASNYYTVDFNGTSVTYTWTGSKSAQLIAQGLVNAINGNGSITGVSAAIGSASTTGYTFTITATTAGSTGFTDPTVSAYNGSDITIANNTTSGANAIAQVDTLVVTGNYAVGDTITETIGNKTYQYEVQSGDTTDALIAQHFVANMNSAGSALPTGVATITASGADILVTGAANGTSFTGNESGYVSTNYGAQNNDVYNSVGPVHNFTGAQDSISVGTGSGVIYLGTGGGWNDQISFHGTGDLLSLVTYEGAFDTGYEAINLTQSSHGIYGLYGSNVECGDVVVVLDGSVAVSNGTVGGISGFNIAPNYSADVIAFEHGSGDSASPMVAVHNFTGNVGALEASLTINTLQNNVGDNAYYNLLNSSTDLGISAANSLDPSGQLAHDMGYINFTTSNGVITFTAEPGLNHALTVAEQLDAAQLIVDAEQEGHFAGFTPSDLSVGDFGVSAIVQIGSNSYVVSTSGGQEGTYTGIYQDVTAPTVALSSSGFSFASDTASNTHGYNDEHTYDNGYAAAADVNGTNGVITGTPTNTTTTSFVQNVVNAGGDTGFNGHWSGVQTLTNYDGDLGNTIIQVKTVGTNYTISADVQAVAHSQQVTLSAGNGTLTGYIFGDFAVTGGEGSTALLNHGFTSLATVGQTSTGVNLYNSAGQVIGTGGVGSTVTVAGAGTDYFLSSYDAAQEIVNAINDNNDLQTLDGQLIKAQATNPDGTAASYTVTDSNISTPNNAVVDVQVNNAVTVQIALPTGTTSVTNVATAEQITSLNANSIIELNGITGLTGFGDQGSSSTVTTANLFGSGGGSVNYTDFIGQTSGNASNVVVNGQGAYSLVESSDVAGLTVGTTSTTISGIGASAIVDLTSSSGSTLGNVTITQAAGSNLVINTSEGSTAGSLTVNGDWFLGLNNNGPELHLANLTDGTNSLTNLELTGSMNIGAINSTVLNSIVQSTGDDSISLGGVTALAVNGLSVELNNGADTVAISGSGDHINIGLDTSNGFVSSVTDSSTAGSNTINVGSSYVTVTATNAQSDSITANAGSVEATAQVSTLTLAGYAGLYTNGQVVSATFGGHTYSYTAIGGQSGSDMATGLAAAIGTNVAGIIVSASGDTVVLTANTANSSAIFTDPTYSGTGVSISDTTTGIQANSVVVTANGAGDLINVGGGVGYAAEVVTANGAGDTINGGDFLTVIASGAGDTFHAGAHFTAASGNVNGAGDMFTVTGTLANITATGASDTFNVYGDESTIVASGVNDTITTGAYATITASGNTDSITSDQYATIVASGNGDTISVSAHSSVVASGVADIIITGALGTEVTAAGAGDTISASMNTSVHASGAADTFLVTGSGNTFDGGSLGLQTLSVGNGDTIEFGASSSATIYLTGDTSVTLTGLNGSAVASYNAFSGSATLVLNNAATETELGQVNVASATTLTGALNLAAATAAMSVQSGSSAAGTMSAHTGLIDWFQFGGNTYVVEAVNNTSSAATHNALGANDAVIKIVGLVDLSSEITNGTVLSGGHLVV